MRTQTAISLLLAICAFGHGNSLGQEAKPVKVFILAGQSNMVGWGDSARLPDDFRKGNDRVLMFEDGKWQPLRPTKKAMPKQKRFGMTEFSFGPEISFAHEMAKAWLDETIGTVKFAIGGTSILAWKPKWSKRTLTVLVKDGLVRCTRS